MALSLFNDPFVGDLEKTMSRAMAPFFGVGPTTAPGMGTIMNMPAVHPMDVIEHPDRYSIVTDAPGMSGDDVHVEINEGTLVVSGEKTHEKKRTDEKAGIRVHRNERTFTRFSRSFTLPDDAKDEGVTARLVNGVLTVDIPKQPKAKVEPKRIKVMGEGGHTGTTATGGTTTDVPVQGGGAAGGATTNA